MDSVSPPPSTTILMSRVDPTPASASHPGSSPAAKSRAETVVPAALASVAGRVIVRQRPSTAGGFLFISLEDETGIANIVTPSKLFKQEQLFLLNQPFLIVEGILQKQDDIISVLAQKFWPLEIFSRPLPSHDFH